MLSPQPHQDSTHTPLTPFVCLHSSFLVNSLDSHQRHLGIVPCAVDFGRFRAGLARPSPILDCFANASKRGRTGETVADAMELEDSGEEGEGVISRGFSLAAQK